MNARERYRETLLFGSPDKVPLRPGGPRESTLRAWHEQGLPEGAHYMTTLLEMLGIEREETQPYVPLDVSLATVGYAHVRAGRGTGRGHGAPRRDVAW